MRYPKRGDVIADLIKQSIVTDGLKPGDRLPTEKQLVEKYEAGKASVREALKSLEVQGLIRTSTGPTGGSFIAEVTETRILNHLQSYFFFKHLTAAQVYELRRVLEPRLAGHMAETASEDLIRRLEANVQASQGDPTTREDWQRHQQIHIEFHDLLADGASNPLLCVHCKFINRSLRSIVRSRESPEQLKIINSNRIWHEKICEAVRKRDSDAAENLMREHIVELENAYKITNPVLRNSLHLETKDPEKMNALSELP
ncbi:MULTISPECIES: FCD domain-containing protein [unclassified Beijerinckia]|uniref:FadR/GntR family transcriptional regulator n=1 Tax=unclassified Beijerinckia TaxID=2638183 RepID=UPI0008998750|nr:MULTISPECIES: FCD domain-containing protein [unclassified Beijerinckia]MDH7799256.1 GntR family transcriptional repressor for pyruvate dehydrogenase complex [Beijerinckia sp. GAS462]SED90556.1 transcriptional regulator, GntR family [Beijerinckia sp. 28-YEA-48]